MRIRFGAGLLAVALGAAGCDTDLELTNPNAPTEQEVLTSIDGILALSLGLQEQFAGCIIDYVRAPGLLTDEFGPGSRALAADQSLFTGSPDPEFGVVSDPYYCTYRIARSANNIIASAPELGLGAGLETGLVATAKLFKAMALGFSAQQFELLPLDATVEGGVPVPRAEVLAEVIRLLESARADLARVPDADLAVFRARGLTSDFDLSATVNAMLARYYLFTGQNQQALEAANRVNLSALSLLTYPDPGRNPIYNYSAGAQYIFPLKSFADQAEAGDQRVGFYVDTDAKPFGGNPPTLMLYPFDFYGTRNAPFPVFLPGEILLIKAEALARLGRIEEARALVNQVRTKTGTANRPGAALPALAADRLDTQAELLSQIAYERRYELFGQGLRLEDLRRLRQYTTARPKLDFLPFPIAECRNNPNAGC